MSWAGFLYDLTIVGWLLWPRTRRFAYLAVLAFHGVTQILFDIGMFPTIMVTSTLIFFAPDWPRRWLGRRGHQRGAVPVSPEAPRLRRPLVAVALAWCAFQALFPLRSHFVSDNVLWDERGMRFSWRVMVRAKGGSTTFLVKSKATGKVWHVSPRRYLTPYQENEMSGQPDLILQLAHSIGEDFALREGPVEVRVEALSSLNARRGAALVDPAVDLLTVRDGLAPARWIAPSPPGPPPPIRPVL
jgi:hypothetical protein